MTRRTLLAALALLLAAPVSAHAATAYIVLSSAPRSMFSIDTATGRRGEVVPVGGPMAFTPDNRTAYVLAEDGVRPLDTASNTVGAAIAVPAGASSIAITPTAARCSSPARPTTR